MLENSVGIQSPLNHQQQQDHEHFEILILSHPKRQKVIQKVCDGNNLTNLRSKKIVTNKVVTQE